jgi:hypothetical protein
MAGKGGGGGRERVDVEEVLSGKKLRKAQVSLKAT